MFSEVFTNVTILAFFSFFFHSYLKIPSILKCLLLQLEYRLGLKWQIRKKLPQIFFVISTINSCHVICLMAFLNLWTFHFPSKERHISRFAIISLVCCYFIEFSFFSFAWLLYLSYRCFRLSKQMYGKQDDVSVCVE